MDLMLHSWRDRRDIDGCRDAFRFGRRTRECLKENLLSVRLLRLVETRIGRGNGSNWVLSLLLHGKGAEYE